MSQVTRATLALDKAGVSYSVHTYDYDPKADRVGVQAAASLGVAPSIVLKTIMAEVDGKAVCVLVPSDREVNMKRFAAAFGGKSAQMIKPDATERLTGYHVGGISPFGQRRRHSVPVRFYARLQSNSWSKQSNVPGAHRPLRIASEARASPSTIIHLERCPEHSGRDDQHCGR